MICPKCDGSGIAETIQVSEYDCEFIPCEYCEGQGEVQTNEEWFDRLSTETKARIAHLVYMAGYRDGRNRVETLSLQNIIEWLKEKHNEHN